MFELTERIDNTGGQSVEVCFEPWGMPDTLAAGESFELVAASSEAGQLEVVKEADRITV